MTPDGNSAAASQGEEPGEAPAVAGAPAAPAPVGAAGVRVVVGSLIAVGLGMVVSYLLWRWLQPPPPAPVEGLSAFAAVYVLAQAIERLLEPFSQLVLPSAGLVRQRDQAVAALEDDPSDPGKRRAAARASATLEQRRADRAVVFWALATVLGLVAAGVLGLRLLALVGVTAAPAGFEIIVTGLAVGGGSKPLHDLITRLQKSKEKAQDAAGQD